jgi:hypothetical protein
VSSILYIEDPPVSPEEKSTWAYAVISVVLPVVYFALVLPQVAEIPVADIEYQVPLLLSIGAAVLLAIGTAIAIAISAPREAGKRDQRDKDVNRYGEYVAGLVLAGAALVPFILAMVEVHQFWIANTLYLAFILSASSGSVAKIVAYRRGL